MADGQFYVDVRTGSFQSAKSAYRKIVRRRNRLPETQFKLIASKIRVERKAIDST